MIRFAKETDINGIMDFIDSYWRKGHILGTNIDFFCYEHLLDEGVTYVISEDTEGKINAILGYIPYGKKKRDIMTVMWKANHTENPSLGLDLFYFLMQNADVRIIASPGSNRKLRGLYTYLGYQFGKMTQWYRIHRKEEYKIARIADRRIPQPSGQQSGFKKYETWEELTADFDFEVYYKTNPKPLKEDWYIKKRYFCHPIYKYEIYGVSDRSDKRTTIFVCRLIHMNGRCALRLVDCIGDPEKIKGATVLIDQLLAQYDAEYIDCYEAGVPDSYFLEAGWIKTEETENIIPNYFAPFVQENVDIYYFSTDPDIILFKGDGDQDRPS
ncbi:MAG: hypothetical protein HDR28_00625 [Lachnospiraceae bacterium]|nr:hypothetical protein [Lachnospiraceae bacterium]